MSESTTDTKYTKWVACWGNATSIMDQTLNRYAKDITLRYPIRCCFAGSQLRLHFSNLTGTEPVTLQAFVAKSNGGKEIDPATSRAILYKGSQLLTIEPGQELLSDALDMQVAAGQELAVSLYLPKVTQMNAGTLVTGPLSKGYYSFGSYAEAAKLPIEQTRNTNWFFFLNTIDILTEEVNHALICYGDSITAQSWPDYLAMRAWVEGYRQVSIIRRAVCGTRILRQYDCATYAAYGLKGATRFPIESKAAGAKTVLIQHGINDIIHPVGRDVNIFRPWSDLPSCEELAQGFTQLYVECARKQGLQVWGGTLLPIYGWRTYEAFREKLKNDFNNWLRYDAQLDGCVDFDKAVCDAAQPERFRDGFDSGDHLHPSEAAYKAMAEAVPAELLK